MNDRERIEKLITDSTFLPDAPEILRSDVRDLVTKRLRQATLRDDIKLLAIRLGVLMVVFASVWGSLSYQTRELKQLTNSHLNAEHRDAMARSSGGWFSQSLTMSSEVDSPGNRLPIE